MLQTHAFSFHTPLRKGVARTLLVPPGEVQKFKSPRFQQEKPLGYHCRQLFASSDNLQKNANESSRKPNVLQRCTLSDDPLECSSMESKNMRFTTSQGGFRKMLNAFYQFSRPHTIFGTVIGITSVSLLPLESFSDISPSLLVGLLKALIPSIAMNIYVVGLNQLFDINIDKVNKPNLPLASGEFSMEFGMAIVSTVLLMSFTLGIMFQSPPLFSALLTSFLLGSAYSVELPSLRWKRNAFLAATCIVLIRGIVVQFAFFIHMQKYVLHRPIMFTRSLIFAVAFMCLFSTVIALFKDIPDVDGDKHFGIRSLSVVLGQERVFWLCISTLLVAYGAAMIIGASSSSLVSKIITVGGHFTFALMLLLRARSVNLYSQPSITSFYMFIWKLFYAEYLLIPLVR